jgi:pyridoxine/pyridoxamine 5'-phosphate oxidase
MSGEVLNEIWKNLEDASRSRSPFNFLQFGTVGLDGSPQIRTVVLRACDVRSRSIAFVTDTRSPKVAEIRRDGRVGLLGYDPQSSVQLRLSGVAAIVANEVERLEVWQRLRPSTLKMFDAASAPSTVLGEGVHQVEKTTAGNDDATSYDRYALIKVVLDRLELLDLSTEPHDRFAFDWSGEAWRVKRLAP